MSSLKLHKLGSTINKKLIEPQQLNEDNEIIGASIKSDLRVGIAKIKPPVALRRKNNNEENYQKKSLKEKLKTFIDFDFK